MYQLNVIRNFIRDSPGFDRFMFTISKILHIYYQEINYDKEILKDLKRKHIFLIKLKYRERQVKIIIYYLFVIYVIFRNNSL